MKYHIMKIEYICCFVLIFLMQSCSIFNSGQRSETSTPANIVPPRSGTTVGTPIFTPTVIGIMKTVDNNWEEHIPTVTLTMMPVATISPTAEALQEATLTPSFLCKKVPDPELSHSTDANSEIYLSGKFALCWVPIFSTFDLDRGILGDENIFTSDIELQFSNSNISGKTDYYIEEINNARIDQTEIVSPSLSACKTVLSSKNDSWFFVEGEVGDSGCVITNEGRIAFIRVESIDPYGRSSIELSFITWNERVKR